MIEACAVVLRSPKIILAKLPAGRPHHSLARLSLNLCVVAIIMLWCIPCVHAQVPAADDSGHVKVSVRTPTKFLLVVGAAGTPEYKSQFEQDAQQWSRLAHDRQMELVTVDSGNGSSEPKQREVLQSAIVDAAKENVAQLWIVLIGHGTSERGTHKFNLVGPDVSSNELAGWLKDVTCSVIVINCSSASAPFLPELSGNDRIVVTATRSGSENNYSRFGTQLANCILDPATDIDHDEEVSLLEAFLAAAANTEKFYREQNRLATEHALIDDNGDKLGTGAEFFRGTRAVKAAQAGKQLDGLRAAQLILHSAQSAPKLSEALQARRAEIEDEINHHRLSKPSPPTDAYWDELERLLLDLADVYAEAQ